MKNNKPKNKLVITWQRLISDGNTCPRCGSTENELDKAVLQLKEKLNPKGIEVVLKKKELTLEEFKKDPIQSNRILFNGKPLEDLIGAETGQSHCCNVCGDKECRTVETKEESHETIPADMIVRAGLVVVQIGV
ncbi:MAG: heavy metal sensor signal transduction histidine kinase [Candidatus Portnoybacteria bacterium RBG_13_40_8]|uniref:Heavy metal sensor signal transduction histidine kinase n=1 Tax=Candidatus Portnoybacteria bacterium RBG_13_40_8 TaxID=1801990 RepID=A0A1G2F2Y3_9BACT|nr:MAG: heavy metal sensor signal transduction histidine kinase [Candidatus Portnoybacteria bacterium RBG_13_40_8]